MDILFVILGLVFAVYGAQLLVDGGSAVAKRFNIPTLVIGSTVVSEISKIFGFSDKKRRI